MFNPTQFYGREHLNIKRWMNALEKPEIDTFYNKVFCPKMRNQKVTLTSISMLYILMINQK
jgi:hypothetical protein